MNQNQTTILLADDDSDDRIFFKDVLDELEFRKEVQFVTNGVELMTYLSNNTDTLPQALFLDLNMPLKNGFECLFEIKSNKKLQQLPIIIISTSLDQGIVEQLYSNGATYYIRKPGDFSQLKYVISEAIAKTSRSSEQPLLSNFVIEYI